MSTRFRCPACGHWCNWVDGYGWICDRRGGCGSEWEEVVRTWEPVHARIDGTGGIVYWRLLDEDRRSLGAVSNHGRGKWHALVYLYEPGRKQNSGRRSLGEFPSWQAARRAVQREV